MKGIYLDVRRPEWRNRFDLAADGMGLVGTPLSVKVNPAIESFGGGECEEFDKSARDYLQLYPSRETYFQAVRALLSDPLFGMFYFEGCTRPQIKSMIAHAQATDVQVKRERDALRKMFQNIPEGSFDIVAMVSSSLERWEALGRDVESQSHEYQNYVQRLAQAISKKDQNQVIRTPERYFVRKPEVRNEILKVALQTSQRDFLYAWDVRMLNRLQSLDAQDKGRILATYQWIKEEVDPELLEKEIVADFQEPIGKIEMPSRLFYESVIANQMTFEQASALEQRVNAFCEQRLQRIFQ